MNHTRDDHEFVTADDFYAWPQIEINRAKLYALSRRIHFQELAVTGGILLSMLPFILAIIVGVVSLRVQHPTFVVPEVKATVKPYLVPVWDKGWNASEGKHYATIIREDYK